MARWQAKQTPAKKRSWTLGRHGLTVEDYDRMFARQEGRCAICQNEYLDGRPLCVDHCHTTGRIRGLLCKACNTYLGRIKDDPSRLVSYLEGRL